MAGSKSPLIDKTLETAKNMTQKVIANAAAKTGSAAVPQTPAATTPNYSIDYTDPGFALVDAEKAAALNQSNTQFDQMISGTDEAYQGLIDAAKQQGDTLAKNQQDRTNFMIEQINQQKDQTQKDYSKEQRAAYADWQKQSDPYGVAAEQMAAAGLRGTGYSESSQVAMYTAYQNRLAVARETFNKAVLNYDNAIKDAQLANNSALAEIAMNTLQTTLTLGLEKLQYNNDLLLQKQAAQREIDNTYYNRRQDEWARQNADRQFAYQQDRDRVADDQWLKQFNYQKDRDTTADAQWDKTFKYQQGRDAKSDDQWLMEFNESIRQYDSTLDYNKARDKAEDDKWLMEYNLQKNKSSGGSGGGSGGIKKGNDGPTIDGKKTVEPKKSGPGPKTAYEAFQTNIGNMMVKGYSEKAITNMENQLKNAVKNGQITEAQYKKLLDLLY